MTQIICIISILLIFQNLQASSFCDAYNPSKEYLSVQQKIDKNIEIFANKKIIASQADNVLSKLLAAGSPMITTWMKKRDLIQKSENEIAKEWRLYFARNFILMRQVLILYKSIIRSMKFLKHHSRHTID